MFVLSFEVGYVGDFGVWFVLEVDQEVGVVDFCSEFVCPDEELLTVEDAGGPKDTGINVTKLPASICVKFLDRSDEEVVFGMGNDSGGRNAEGFCIHAAVFDYKVIGVFVVLVLILMNPQISAAISWTAIDGFRELSPDLIDGFAEVVPWFLGVGNDGCRNKAECDENFFHGVDFYGGKGMAQMRSEISREKQIHLDVCE